MPDIRPFRAVVYNTQKVQLNNVIAPPYDVISADQQTELYERDQHNIVRLILGRENNWYTLAASMFQQWKGQAILLFDTAPAFYVVAQEFHLPDGKKYVRKGFVCACKLETIGDGSIYPHEKTHSKPKEDRFRLFQSTNAMFSQIFSLYGDRSQSLDTCIDDAMQPTPFLEADFEGVKNRVWRLTDTSAVRSITEFMKHQKVLIADGHHRYETALLYRDAMRQKFPNFSGDEAFNFVPMFFTNMYDEGLVILPTHRVLHSLPNFSYNFLTQKLQPYFNLEQVPSLDVLQNNLRQKRNHAFGVVIERKYLLITLKYSEALIKFDVPNIYRNLDVAILHSVIFNHLLGISEAAQESKLNLDYVKEADDAVKLVESGKAQVAFLLNPTPIEQVREIAEAGFTMPQKSTYFYPKLLSGLLTYSFLES